MADFLEMGAKFIAGCVFCVLVNLISVQVCRFYSLEQIHVLSELMLLNTVHKKPAVFWDCSGNHRVVVYKILMNCSLQTQLFSAS